MNPPRILIVDDEPDLLRLFSSVLAEAGYKVLQAKTATECLQMVKDQLPDLVLLDVILPDLDGMEVCKLIKADEATARILVIQISGMLISDDNAAEALEAGADGYLTKPVEPRALLAHVNALLRWKQAEQSLARSEEQFRAAFDNALDAMLIADDQAKCVDANPAACALFGVPRDELLNRSLSDFLETAQWRPSEKEWLTFIEEGEQRGDFRLHRPDGTTRDFEYRAKASFLPHRHLSVLRDVTERKQAAEELRMANDELEKRVDQRAAELVAINTVLQEEIAERKRADQASREADEKYRGIFENALYGIFQSSPNGRLISANPAMARLFGYESADELIAYRAEIDCQHYVELNRRADFEKLIAEDNIVHNFELQCYRKDGSKIWTSENVRAVFDASGKLLYYEGIVEDITARKHVEEERALLLRRLVTAQEEEQRRLSRELHDQMGQSIAALLLGLKALDDSAQFKSTEINRLHQLQDLTNQLAHVVHHLASSLRPTALDDLGLDTALSNHVEEWSERTGIRADLHCNGLIQQRLSPQVETTVYRIVQEALTNVLKHAKAQNVSVIVEHRGNRVRAIVEDDGSGFDVEAMIQKPLSERRLGLMGMKERASLVGGRLDIESAPGAGTTVILYIPISSPQLGGSP